MAAAAALLIGMAAVTPAGASLPPGGTFLDDDGNPHEGAIEAIAAAGITRGCTPTADHFCPDSPVTRAQMAAFLARARSLPAATQDYFDDDTGSIFEDAINRLAEAGITRGCAAASFCPDALVNRAEMAAFLRRAYQLTASSVDHFDDDDGSPFEPDIDALAAAGITRGCDARRFCPYGAVRRDEMASFLARAEGLQLLVPPPRSCQVFPSDNIWNTRVDGLPVHPRSDQYVASIGATAHLHPDFGSGVWPPGSNSPIGIPFVTVGSDQPLVPIHFFAYGDESDPGPYPVPPDAPIEGGPDSEGDRHVLVVDTGRCRLYELFDAHPQPDGSWEAASGAVFDLNSNALRPSGWTSADAAGLPIYPGLVRYQEVASGRITHALRFTAPRTQAAYVWPARHHASSSTDPQLPPMGQRFRLRADYDLSGFSPETRVILVALKEYGMILADNGSPWYLSGAPDERWDNRVLAELKQVPGSAFEAVDVSSLQVDPDSAAVRP